MSSSLLVAIAIGIAFGFTLERAGLGNARKLAGQFYFTDFTVFKVMFSAIVVAMLGAFWLSRLGLLDLRGVYVPDTWLMPQLAGGLLFGAGFVVAGLCPGTSCVSAATGRGDGLAAVGGMFFGVLVVGLTMGLAFTPLQRFYESTGRGAFTLPELLHVPYGAVVFAIVAMALLAFLGLRRLAAADEPSPTMHRGLGSMAILLGALAAFAGSPYRATLDVRKLGSEVTREEDHVTAIELAGWIKDRKPGLRVLDLRPEAAFDEYHLPGAENVTLDALLTTTRYASTDTLVLISDGGAHAAQGWVFLRALGYEHVYFLRGGLGEWLDEVMNPARTTALTRYFGGTPRSDSDARTNTVTNMRRRGC
jgi:rhodanese-related sulfurtransferase